MFINIMTNYKHTKYCLSITNCTQSTTLSSDYNIRAYKIFLCNYRQCTMLPYTSQQKL